MENFVPKLGKGAHAGPEDGACVMEMVSFLAGEGWSDTPMCTNIALARLAQSVNDNLDDRNRGIILRDFDRLFNTNLSLNQEVDFAEETVLLDALVIHYARRKLVGPFAYSEMFKNFHGKTFTDYVDEIDNKIADCLTVALNIYDSRYRKAPAEKQDLTKLEELIGAN